MRSGTLETPRIRELIKEGLEELRVSIVGHRESGRVGMAERLELFVWCVDEYLKIMDKALSASRETCLALAETVEDLRK